MIDRVWDVIEANDLAVLATQSADGPRTSLMAYLARPDRRRLYMMTGTESRKYANMTARPRVSLLIDNRLQTTDRAEMTALTITAVFRPLSDPEEAGIRAELVAARPHLAELAAGPEARAFALEVIDILILQGPTKSRLVRLVAQDRESEA